MTLATTKTDICDCSRAKQGQCLEHVDCAICGQHILRKFHRLHEGACADASCISEVSNTDVQETEKIEEDEEGSDIINAFEDFDTDKIARRILELALEWAQFGFIVQLPDSDTEVTEFLRLLTALDSQKERMLIVRHMFKHGETLPCIIVDKLNSFCEVAHKFLPD